MKLTYRCTHSFDGENDVELSILYVYTPPSPARGPSYDCGGEPATDPEVDMIGLMVNDRAATNEQWDMMMENERLYDEMMIHGADCVADERAAAAEYRAEMMRE
jgi:hypothetical protein